MRGLGVAHGFFKRIHDRGTFPYGLKTVALLLSFPCFYASNFFFKLAYLGNQRRLLRVGRQGIGLSGKDRALQLNHFPLNLRHCVELQQALGDLTCDLQACKCSLNEGQIHGGAPEVPPVTPNNDGNVQFLGDCDHELSGQTVALLDVAEKS